VSGSQFFIVVVMRIMVVLLVCGTFLPPDTQNPHALGDVFLMIGAGFIWAAGDLMVAEPDKKDSEEG
jgi:hypothetical protein